VLNSPGAVLQNKVSHKDKKDSEMNNSECYNLDSTSKLLEKAKNAWQMGYKYTSGMILAQILEQDITHPAAWELLYDQLGKGLAFDEFQYNFVKKYYPEKAFLIRNGAAPECRPLAQANPSTIKKLIFAIGML
jgi:hypothetical protein